MKKLYTSAHWKKHSKAVVRRHDKALRRQPRKYEKRTGEGPFGTAQAHAPFIRRTDYKIVAPSDFSIVDNTEPMLLFFDEIRIHSKKSAVFLDLSAIQKMTPDALLYMLSVLERYPPTVRGNLPDNEKCKQLFHESEFLKFVYSNINYPKSISGRVLAIQTGQRVIGVTAKHVTDFAKTCLNRNESLDFKGVYATLIECMANTKDHAYTKWGKWWAICTYDQELSKVSFAFLDNGNGIPKTIRKNFLETVAKILPNAKDSALIMSALLGQFRTSTLKKERGKGLPKIYSQWQDKRIEDLRIISNQGYIDRGTPSNLPMKFHGTLLVWDFI